MIKPVTSQSFHKQLKQIFNLPHNVKRFQLIAEPDSVVTVKIEYYPEKDACVDALVEFCKYSLEERD